MGGELAFKKHSRDTYDQLPATCAPPKSTTENSSWPPHNPHFPASPKVDARFVDESLHCKSLLIRSNSVSFAKHSSRTRSQHNEKARRLGQGLPSAGRAAGPLGGEGGVVGLPTAAVALNLKTELSFDASESERRSKSNLNQKASNIKANIKENLWRAGRARKCDTAPEGK